MRAEPYKVTAIWDQDTLPAAIRNEHSTKAGTWGLLRVLDGEVDLVFSAGHTVRVTVGQPGVIPPQDVHHVEFTGPFRMQVEFYKAHPLD